ncbi:hypothetical protein ACFV9G_18535 [Nocardioides sp. NPDC059952]|uniref:hypothetical protein n=1 Tax=Nocardioides sp. NPDC059952 TaxID=3347014 RepID=UPI00365AC888
MDVDVVPGSVTDWSVTLEDQRRLKRALVGLRLRMWAYWIPGLVLPVVVASLFWLGMPDPDLGLVGGAVELAMTAVLGVAILLLQLAAPLWGLRRQVERELPVGATLTAWTTPTGLGVRTLNRLTFYPWSRLSQVEVGPVLVRCRQDGPNTLVMPAYLPTGPDELARSVDFPVQLIGPEIRRELAERAGRTPVAAPLAGAPIVVDRTLRWRLVRARLRAQFGALAWVLPVGYGLNALLQLEIGSFWSVAFWGFMALFILVTLLLVGTGRVSGMYPVGATVVGSVGEWLEIQGSWGSVAWHNTWLRQRRTTEHTVAYEMVPVGPDGQPRSQANAGKRYVVIPRAFLDTPAEAVSAEV